jgi:hypothetical protein
MPIVIPIYHEPGRYFLLAEPSLFVVHIARTVNVCLICPSPDPSAFEETLSLAQIHIPLTSTRLTLEMMSELSPIMTPSVKYFLPVVVTTYGKLLIIVFRNKNGLFSMLNRETRVCCVPSSSS